jgi:hypothetical protein
VATRFAIRNAGRRHFDICSVTHKFVGVCEFVADAFVIEILEPCDFLTIAFAGGDASEVCG